MAVITITEAQVVPAASNRTTMVSASALAVGDIVYESSSGVATKADNSTAVKAAVKGMCISSCAASGQAVVVQTGGSPTLGAGAAPVQGTVYALSATAGKLYPVADLVSGKYVTIVGVGAASNVLTMHIHASGIAVA